MQVDLAWAKPELVPELPLKEWWTGLHVIVSDSNGVVREINGSEIEVVEARTKGVLVAGSRQASSNSALPHATFVLFTLPPIPSGDYSIKASMRLTIDPAQPYRLRSYEEMFSVRRGDEDGPTHRLYLRKQASAAANYDEYKRIQLELLKLEPRNSGIVEGIAIRSLNTASPEETRDWYQRAYAMRLQNARDWEKEHGKFTPEERRRVDGELARLSAFGKLYDVYVARRGDFRLIPFRSARQDTFAWVNRDGHIVGVVDLNDPTNTRPLER